jgi:hypothetical protein
MVATDEWMRRRWYEFRAGHSFYLVFVMTFVNFVLIFYRLLIEQVPSIYAILPQLWIFAILFLLIYPPVAVLIGHWHRKSQLRTEMDLTFLASPFWAKVHRIQMQVLQGTASKEEVEEVMNILKRAEKGNK